VAQLHLHSNGDASPLHPNAAAALGTPALAALLLLKYSQYLVEDAFIPDILSRHALPSGRLAVLGATMDLHHGLLAQLR